MPELDEFHLDTDAILSGSKTVPMICPECRSSGKQYGRLMLEESEPTQCPNHKKRVMDGTISRDRITLIPAPKPKRIIRLLGLPL